ncbi:Sodium/hydrogen exchanger 2 [Zea mays]|uniref:Sodium/hydrogen exchanger 2 n=2 Tax=Zea mays TaxID=4577 RepID=A0A1D6PKS5_MAIZE|nr:Sodium/hydrogen exchanger 2 [Zea mays]
MLREVSLTNATFNSQLISIGALGLISRLNIGALELGDYLALGAIFSATDSICTLQVLSQDETPFLYNHVFGEGVVNDATSVVLFNAIQNFDPRNISGAKLLNFIGSFLYLFGSSTILGVASGLLSAYTIKKLYFGRHSTDREVSIMMLMAYLSSMLAEVNTLKFEGHNQVSSFIPSVWTFAFDHAFFGNAYANVIVWWAGLMRGAVSIVLAYNKVRPGMRIHEHCYSIMSPLSTILQGKTLAILHEFQVLQVVAIGECGLDYDRLQFCPADMQKKYFEKQFELSEAVKLPMFLHMRAAGEDFCEIMTQNLHRFPVGVTHSFTDLAEDWDRLLSFENMFIGVNGCSLKTNENLEVLRGIPVERLMIETDSPYCDIINTHARSPYVKSVWPFKKKEKYEPDSTVKGRNEPCLVRQVLEVVVGSKGISGVEGLSRTLYHNTCRLFFPQDLDASANAQLESGTAVQDC